MDTGETITAVASVILGVGLVAMLLGIFAVIMLAPIYLFYLAVKSGEIIYLIGAIILAAIIYLS